MLLQLETFPEHVHHFTIKPFSLAGGGDPLESLITFYCELKFEIGYGKKLLSREGEWRVKLQTKVHPHEGSQSQRRPLLVGPSTG